MPCTVDDVHGNDLHLRIGDIVTIKRIKDGFVYFSADTECTEEMECEYYKESDTFWQYFVKREPIERIRDDIT